MQHGINFFKVDRHGHIEAVLGLKDESKTSLGDDFKSDDLIWRPYEASEDGAFIDDARQALRWFPLWTWMGDDDKDVTPSRPEYYRELLNPNKGQTALFLKMAIEYPRFLMPDGMIVLGGKEFLLPERMSEIAEELVAGKMVEGLRAKKSSNEDEIRRIASGACFLESSKGFSRPMEDFRTLINWLGDSFPDCTEQTCKVVIAMDRFVDGFETAGLEQLPALEMQLSDVCAALEKLCLCFAGIKADQLRATAARKEAAKQAQTSLDGDARKRKAVSEYDNRKLRGYGIYKGSAIEVYDGNKFVISGKDTTVYEFPASCIRLMDALIRGYIGEGSLEGWVKVPERKNRNGNMVKIPWRQNLKTSYNAIAIIDAGEPATSTGGARSRIYTGRVRFKPSIFASRQK